MDLKNSNSNEEEKEIYYDAVGNQEEEDNKINKVINIHNYCPTEEDSHLVFDVHEQRLLFREPQQFRQDEMNKILDFQNWLNDNQLDIPEQYDYREMFRWLQSMKFDYRTTYNAIYANFEFFNKILPINIDNFQKYFNSGFLYFLNRDKKFRPVWVIDMAKLIDEIGEEDILEYTVMTLEYVVDKGLVPGKVENWIVIVDCSNLWATQISTSQIQTMAKAMQQNYPGRLYKLFAVGVSFTLRAIWAIASNFIDSFTEYKVKIYGSGYEEDLLEFIDEDKLEQKFGGWLPNKTENFFPPTFN